MRAAFVLLVAYLAAVQGALTFTGDAQKDFLSQPNAIIVLDPSGAPDVGVPAQVQNAAGTIISGWDMRQILFIWEPAQDRLNIGIDCYGICGDADGRDGPDTTSVQLASIGGEDTRDLSGSESFAIAIDLDMTLPADVIVGIPGGNPTIGTPLTCGDFSMANCAGIYEFLALKNIAPAFLFKLPITNVVFENFNKFPSAAAGDLEFRINTWSKVMSAHGKPFAVSPFEPWQFNINAFAGSFVDSGVGEDYLPDQNSFVQVRIPCQQFDACDVCLGNGNTCLDCKAIPNGPNRYDACDVCGGNGRSCADCAGTPNGAAKYDQCDVCNGNGQSCLDCKRMPFGTSRYDVCDICGGNGDTCLDCKAIPNGPNRYDACDVCGGNGRSCLDCAGMPNGAAKYDQCDVCNGNGESCLDCKRMPFGTNKYDVCDICGGMGDTCLDCAGMPNGPNNYDVCDICGGDGTSCLDCNGVPNGPAMYDECDVCGGDGTTCLQLCTSPSEVPQTTSSTDSSSGSSSSGSSSSSSGSSSSDSSSSSSSSGSSSSSSSSGSSSSSSSSGSSSSSSSSDSSSDDDDDTTSGCTSASPASTPSAPSVPSISSIMDDFQFGAVQYSNFDDTSVSLFDDDDDDTHQVVHLTQAQIRKMKKVHSTSTSDFDLFGTSSSDDDDDSSSSSSYFGSQTNDDDDDDSMQDEVSITSLDTYERKHPKRHFKGPVQIIPNYNWEAAAAAQPEIPDVVDMNVARHFKKEAKKEAKKHHQ